MGPSNVYATYYYPAIDDPNNLSKIQTRGECRQDVLDQLKLRLNEHEWLTYKGLIELELY